MHPCSGREPGPGRGQRRKDQTFHFNIIKYEVQTHTDWGSDYLELLFRGQFDRGEYESFVKAVKDYFGGHEILVSDASLYMV